MSKINEDILISKVIHDVAALARGDALSKLFKIAEYQKTVNCRKMEFHLLCASDQLRFYANTMKTLLDEYKFLKNTTAERVNLVKEGGK